MSYAKVAQCLADMAHAAFMVVAFSDEHVEYVPAHLLGRDLDPNETWITADGVGRVVLCVVPGTGTAH